MRLILNILLFVSIVVSGNAMALPSSNLSFEDQFLGWDVFGNATIQSLSVANNGTEYTATDGEYFVELVTDNGVSTVDYNGGAGTNGSILQSNIDLAAGDILSFDWAFFTDDYQPFNDFSLFINAQEILLADVDSVGDYGNGAWSEFSWTAINNYSGDISFVVSNVMDNIVPSTLLIDNIKVMSISAPDAPLLFALGIIVIYFSKRKITSPAFG